MFNVYWTPRPAYMNILHMHQIVPHCANATHYLWTTMSASMWRMCACGWWWGRKLLCSASLCPMCLEFLQYNTCQSGWRHTNEMAGVHIEAFFSVGSSANVVQSVLTVVSAWPPAAFVAVVVCIVMGLADVDNSSVVALIQSKLCMYTIQRPLTSNVLTSFSTFGSWFK